MQIPLYDEVDDCWSVFLNVLFPGAFYPSPPGFDGAAAYVPPPPYSASLAQAPLDPDLPRTPAGLDHSHSTSVTSRPE